MSKGLTHSPEGARPFRRAASLRRRLLPFIIAAFVLVPSAFIVSRVAADTGTGSVSINTAGVPYTQNFDTLSNVAASTTNTALPAGWYITEGGGGARDNEQYAVDTGGSTTGDIYSYGAAAATDRALGQLRSGTLIPLFGAKFTNNTGATITSLSVAYTGEEWRLGAAARATAPTIDQMNFEISTNATDLSTGTYTNVAALNFVSPDNVTAGAKNGNAAADRTALSTTINGLSIPAGASFFIRWTDTDASGADDGLAIDDFSITPFGGSIGTNGYRTTDIQGTDDGGYAMALQPDGKIVVGGYAVNVSGNKDFALARYNYDGSLDTTFGGGTGKVVTDFNGTSDRVWGIALQPDGKIVAAGETVSLVFPGTNDIAVARYNTNGTLDTSFGGTGKVTTDHGGGASNAAYGVAMSGTNIIVAGYENVSGNNDFMVARYTTAGVLDPAFGTLGVTTTGFSGFNDVARAVAIDSSGNIVLGGYANNGSDDDFAVARFTPAGALDTTFVAGAGKTSVNIFAPASADQAFGLAIAPTGAPNAGTIVLAGSAYNPSTNNKDFALVRYSSAGALQGVTTTDFGNSPDVANSVYIRSSDGFIVAGGFSRFSTSSDDFSLARYNAAGTLDPTFDGDGKLTMRISNADERVYAVAREFDGKIVAAGFSTTANSNPVQHDFALARFNADGTLDSTNAATLNNPDLFVNVTGPQNPNTAVAGSQFAYTVTVENRGGANATNVVLTDTLPAGVGYVGSTATQGTPSQAGGVVTDNVGTLAPGAVVTLTINVTAGQTLGLVVDTATATLTEADPTPGNNTATEYTRIIAAPDAITDLSFSPSTVVGGCQNSTGTVTLSSEAPQGGTTVTLASADPAAATAPATVVIPAGQRSVTFNVTTGAVNANKTVRFEATLGSSSFVRRINVNAGQCN